MIKRFIAAVAIATCSWFPVEAKTTHQDHNELWNALEEVGVEIFVNQPQICDDAWGGGRYMTLPLQQRSAIFICQDKGEGLGLGNFATWSANDYDTLRHEAHHVVQDCLGGVRADRDLENMFKGEELKRFVRMALTKERIKWIIENYVANGADEETVLLELEAFAVADDVEATTIARTVRRVCS